MSKGQNNIQKHSSLYTKNQVQTMLDKQRDACDAFLEAECNLENELTYIYAVVMAGVRANSHAVIQDMLTMRAGKLSQSVVNRREVVGDSESEPQYEPLHMLVQLVLKAATKGDTEPLVKFVQQYSTAQVIQFMGGRSVQRKRGAKTETLALVANVKRVLDTGMYSKDAAFQLTAEELNSTYDAVKSAWYTYNK